MRTPTPAMVSSMPARHVSSAGAEVSAIASCPSVNEREPGMCPSLKASASMIAIRAPSEGTALAGMRTPWWANPEGTGEAAGLACANVIEGTTPASPMAATPAAEVRRTVRREVRIMNDFLRRCDRHMK